MMCCLLLLPCLLPPTSHAASAAADYSTTAAYAAADTLQVRPELERFLSMRNRINESPAIREELLSLRAFVLRRILLGALDVRTACNKVDIELAYTYGVLNREQGRQGNVNQFLNLLNFAQFSTLYTLEPYSRIHLKFKQSAILTCVGAGVGTALPICGILYNKYRKVSDAVPPAFLAHVLDGGSVSAIAMPPTVERFLDSPSSSGGGTVKSVLYDTWKKRCGADINKPETLCSLKSPGGKDLGVFNKRLVLLWSLQRSIQEFEPQLLALNRLVRGDATESVAETAQLKASSNLTRGAAEAARLLKIQPQVEELIGLIRLNDFSIRRTELEVMVLERVVGGFLEMNGATGRIDGELNYAYDVVLSGLLARRGKGLQRNYEANFIQTGIFGAIAGLLFLKEYPKAGNEIFLVQSGIGTALSALALWQLRGGARKVDTEPNSLAAFFSVGAPDYQFSPLVVDFLDAPSPESATGKSRRAFVLERWKERRVATINLDKKENQEKVAAVVSDQRDTIRVVRNRIDLLHSLKARLEEFDSELFELVEATGAAQPAAVGSAPEAQLNQSAKGMARLLDVQPNLNYLYAAHSSWRARGDELAQQLFLTRKVLASALESQKVMAQMDLEIATETTARDRIVRQRDLATNLTNNANFFQINILGLIADGPLALSSDPTLNLYGNRVNIVSGYMVGGLAGLTAIEHHVGGVRLTKAQPNSIGPAFGLEGSAASKPSPLVLRFLNAVPASSIDGLTRKEELVAYWKATKVCSEDMSRRGTVEKLAASGPGHHAWNESIRLISNRLRMLYDLRAVTGSMSVGLAEILRETN